MRSNFAFRYVTWTLGLLVGLLVWADFPHVALYKASATQMPVTARLGTTLGIALPVFLGSGLVGAVTWTLTRKPQRAMWVWTVALVVGVAFLSIGLMYNLANPL